MDMKEIRQKYPQYSDLSDEQVARGFHSKFYSDMPYDDFSKKIGLTKAPEIQPTAPKTFDYEAWKKKGWGTGVEQNAYDIGGKVTDLAAKTGLSAEVSGGLGYAANVGAQAIPMLFGGEIAKGAAPLMERGAQRLMQSAIKPSAKHIESGAATKAVQGMLEEGISATPAGMEKIKGMVSSLNKQVADKIATSPSTISANQVVKSLAPTLDKFTKQVNPVSDIAAIEAAKDAFLKHPLLTSDNIPIQLAQQLKQGTYKQLSGKYGELGSAATEAQKALARGLRTEISTAVPEVVKLNAQETKLLNMLNVTERRAIMEANKNPMGLSLLSANPKALAAFMADRSAAFKSIAARLIYAGREQIPANVARAAIAAGMSESGNSE